MKKIITTAVIVGLMATASLAQAATVILDEKNTNSLVEIQTDGTMVFRATEKQIKSLKIGDVITTATLTNKCPDGFLRRIKSIHKTTNGYYILTTEQATMADGLSDGNLEIQGSVNWK